MTVFAKTVKDARKRNVTGAMVPVNAAAVMIILTGIVQFVTILVFVLIVAASMVMKIVSSAKEPVCVKSAGVLMNESAVTVSAAFILKNIRILLEMLLPMQKLWMVEKIMVRMFWILIDSSKMSAATALEKGNCLVPVRWDSAWNVQVKDIH